MQAAMMMTFISTLQTGLSACISARRRQPSHVLHCEILPVPHKQLNGLPWASVNTFDDAPGLLPDTYM